MCGYGVRSLSLKHSHSIIRTITGIWLPSVFIKQAVCGTVQIGVFFSYVVTDIFLEWCKLVYLLKRSDPSISYVISRLDFLGSCLYVVRNLFLLFWTSGVFRELRNSIRLAQPLSPWQRWFQRMEILNLIPQEKKGTLVVFQKYVKTFTEDLFL